MISFAGCATYKPSDIQIPSVESLHSEEEKEETFLRELEKHRKVYFDWGMDSFNIFIAEKEDLDLDDNNWVNIEAFRFAKILRIPIITSVDSVLALGSMKIAVVICNHSTFGPKNNEQERIFLETIKHTVPGMEVSFYKNSK